MSDGRSFKVTRMVSQNSNYFEMMQTVVRPINTVYSRASRFYLWRWAVASGI